MTFGINGSIKIEFFSEIIITCNIPKFFYREDIKSHFLKQINSFSYASLSILFFLVYMDFENFNRSFMVGQGLNYEPVVMILLVRIFFSTFS